LFLFILISIKKGFQMKKLFAALAILAAGSMAQAQTLSDHPSARNDRAPSIQVAERGHEAYRRAEHRRAEHRRMKRHARHYYRHHRG
jgi:hypothetical protein